MFIEIHGIKKAFGQGDSRVQVLKGIDLELERGEFCVLLGPSGSASPPCSTSSATSTPRTAERSASAANTAAP